MIKPFAVLLAAERPRHWRERLERLAPGEAEAILRESLLVSTPYEQGKFWQAMKTAILEATDA